ncbi:hypothetical protein COCOBI_06-6860 [Coccomyxa sp. Obi]|nr:hypothetical protein COCOBI_06-6860 [Coccomyxa sp. Obi]
MEKISLDHVVCAIDECSNDDIAAFHWICSHWAAAEFISLMFDYRKHQQARKLGFPLKMMAAVQAPESQQPQAAKEFRLCTQSRDPDLAPWLLWALGGMPNVTVAELLLPGIPTGLPVMPKLAHLVLRAHVINPADVQSLLQAAPNLEKLLLGRDWCIDQPPQDEVHFDLDFSTTGRLRHLSLEHIRPLSLIVPEGCTVSLQGELRELHAMFGRPEWKLHGGCLHMLEAWGTCHSGLAAEYPHVTTNLAGEPVLTFQSSSEDWIIGPLPKEATAQIKVLDLAAQDLAVTVPSWPALRHVRLEPRGDLTLKFEDAATSAATLESFELFDRSCDRNPGFKRFQKELSALGRRLIPRGKGYNKPKVLEQPADAVTDVAQICVCGCCTKCLCDAGILSDARSVQEIVPLRHDGGFAADDYDDYDEDDYDEDDYE